MFATIVNQLFTSPVTTNSNKFASIQLHFAATDSISIHLYNELSEEEIEAALMNKSVKDIPREM